MMLKDGLTHLTVMKKNPDKRLLPIGKNKKVIGSFKDELRGKIMEEFCALRAKTYAYLINGLCLKTMQILCLMIKSYYDDNKNLKVTIMRCTQKKSIR